MNGKRQRIVEGGGGLSHRGGWTPFSVDITKAVSSEGSVSTLRGAHEIVVRVSDPTGGAQLRGKQSNSPKGIWYTACSGIWQSVWVETVPRQHIESVSTRSKNGPRHTRILTVSPVISASRSPKLGSSSHQLPPGYRLEVEVRGMGGETHVSRGSTSITALVPPTIDVTIADPKAWSPSTPYLYDIVLRLLADVSHTAAAATASDASSSGAGGARTSLRVSPDSGSKRNERRNGESSSSLPSSEVLVDEVTSYMALREVGTVRGGKSKLYSLQALLFLSSH